MKPVSINLRAHKHAIECSALLGCRGFQYYYKCSLIIIKSSYVNDLLSAVTVVEIVLGSV